jgi:hypothetical protein
VATCFSSAESVFSANVLGYKRIAVPSNQFVLVALNFNNVSNTVNGLFGTLPTGSSVSIWDSSPAPAGQKWVAYNKIRGGWSPSGTNVIAIGSGVFIKTPANTNVVLAGEVPLAATNTLQTQSNLFKILSYPYPVNMAFTNTAIAKGAQTGDAVSFWNNGWLTYNKIRGGWSPTATNVQLQIGSAMLYKGVTDRTINEVKPYTIN